MSGEDATSEEMSLERLGVHATTNDDPFGLLTLLNQGLDPNTPSHGTPLLNLAAYRGSLPMVSALLRHGANVHALGRNGVSALMAACCGAHVLVVEHLLSRGADVSHTSSFQRTALDHAVTRQSADIVRLLLAHGARVQDMSEWLLLSAMRNGQTTISQLLIDHGAEPLLGHQWSDCKCVHCQTKTTTWLALYGDSL